MHTLMYLCGVDGLAATEGSQHGPPAPACWPDPSPKSTCTPGASPDSHSSPKLTPNPNPNPNAASVQVAPCYPKRVGGFVEEVTGLLQTHAAVLDPALRQTLVKALILMRNRGQVSQTETELAMEMWDQVASTGG